MQTPSQPPLSAPMFRRIGELLTGNWERNFCTLGDISYVQGTIRNFERSDVSSKSVTVGDEGLYR